MEGFDMIDRQDFTFTRTIRTPSSERFVIAARGTDAAAMDIHFLADGTVDGTVVVVEGGPVGEADVPDLLHIIDEILLPQVSLEDKKLAFTVILGRSLGAFVPESDEAARSS